MHVVVLGTGMIGTTVVCELVHYSVIKTITAVDVSKKSIDKCLDQANHSKVKGFVTSLQSEEEIYKVLLEADIGVACLPHSLSLPVIRAAIKAECHIVDLVGSKFEEKINLDDQAKEAGVLIVPGCGVAPGITNFLVAQGIQMLDEAHEAVMICGGIPRHPLPPLWYQVVFRLESVMGLYTRPATAVENGELIKLPPISGLEKLTFPDPVGECEAVITDAHSTAHTLKDKVNKLYEKTVRYAGHWDKMATLAELGFFDDTPIDLDGHYITPRFFTEKILAPKLKGESNEDITVLRVDVYGLKEGEERKITWEMIDFYDHKRDITSMAKTTAIPAMLMATWIASGKVKERGIVPIENIIIGDRFLPFMEELNQLGVQINFYDNKL
ncbi:saccharopine dehydrogenase [Heyndrickxia sporothermodurans]|nr:saccharopine dehydrogenase [Heyndrickxia sporothermodurans]